MKMRPWARTQTRRASVYACTCMSDESEREKDRRRWRKSERERGREDARFSSRTSLEHRARRIYKWVITVWKGNKGGWHTAVDVKSRGQGYGRGQGSSNKYILTWESLADGLMHNNCNGHLSRTYTARHVRMHAGRTSSLSGPLCCRITVLASSRQIL